MNGQELAAGVRPGEILAGKYRIDRVLGTGGMGVVVAAHHLHLDDRVAIKFLLPHALSNPEAVARFAREAQAAVKIKSEHVARVTDVGTLDNGSPYMVMEYLEGGDLSAWLEQHGRVTPEQAVEFVLQACEAIAEAHALGIIHRDLKPGNLFVTRRPDGSRAVKVLDFGISKRTGLGGSAPSMTQTSASLGSPLYMSPEQMRSSKDVDARSDVWAIGVILHELVSGEAPFLAETMPELVLKVVSDTPAGIRARHPDVPEGLERAIFRCLAKERAQRYASVRELASAIAPYGPSRAAISVQRISGILPAAAADEPAPAKSRGGFPGDTAASWGQTEDAPAPGRSPARLAALAAAVAAISAVAYALLSRGSPEVSAEVRPPASSVAASVLPRAPPAVTQALPAPVVSTAPSAVSSGASDDVPVPPATVTPEKPAPAKPRAAKPSRRAPSGDLYDDRK